MSDNTQVAGGTGDVIRDVQRGGSSGPKTQVVGLDLTPGGGSETLMNGSMPVADSSAAALLTAIEALLGGALGVSAASLPLPAGAATQTTLAAILTALASVPVTGTFFQATQPVSMATASDVVSTLTPNRKVVATAGTAVPLVASSTPCKWVAISGLDSNTKAVYVGNSAVKATLTL